MNIAERARLEELRLYEILDTQPEAYFDRLTQLAARACQTPMALMSLVDGERLWFKSCFGMAATETQRDGSLCAQIISSARPLVCENAKEDSRFNMNSLVKGEPGIRFYAGVPLKTARGLLVGTLCVIDRVSRTLSQEQLDTLTMIADQAVQQLELRRMSEALRRQTAFLEGSQATAHIGSWELDLPTQTLTWSAETYRIHELDPAVYKPTLATALNFYSEASASHIGLAVTALIDTECVYDLELQLITQSGAHRWVRTTGQRDINHPRLFGVFQDITERRNLESEVLAIAQREQMRIGIDLHDDLGQALTGISLLLKEATSNVPEDEPVHHKFREIEGLLSRAIGTCRTLAHGLAPVSEAQGGLPHALKKLGVRLESLHGTRILVIVVGFARPPESVADHLYRIAQEALTNAIRHAAAKEVVLSVDLNPERIILAVTDDGQGIQSDGASDGIGISVMRYRARLIGASLSVEATPTGGTRVQCLLLANAVRSAAKDYEYDSKAQATRNSR